MLEIPIGALKRSRGESLSKSENDLLESLRLIVRVEAAQVGSGKKLAKEAGDLFRLPQLVFIVALALDLALLYVYLLDLFPGVEQNRIVSSLAKLLPIVGGTLLVTISTMSAP